MEIKNEFIPYEQALALKELGFDEPCFTFWIDKNNWGVLRQVGYYNNGFGWCNENQFTFAQNKYLSSSIVRPTFSQAFRFFREKYNLQVYIDFYHKDSYFYKIKSQVGKRISNTTEDVILQGTPVFPRTYEEAELACLKKLIEIVKNK
jgi:hypothetical protein